MQDKEIIKFLFAILERNLGKWKTDEIKKQVGYEEV